MKKIFSLFTALLFAGSIFASTDVKITLANAGWSSTKGKQSGTVSGVTVACDNGVGNTQLRLYKNSTTTISVASTNVVKKIVFYCTAKGTAQYGPGCFTAQTGYSYSDKVGTWTGEATSVSFVASTNQVRAESIIVTVDVAPAVITPVINAEEFFYDEQDVSITCSTTDAKIYYTLDGTDPTASSTEYTDTPFKLNETKTVKAIAIKGDDKSKIASKTLTKNPSFASFEALVAASLAEHTLVEVAFENVKVDSIYLNKDSKRYGIYFAVNEKVYEIYSNKDEISAEWVAGGTIAGTIRGDWYSYNGLWEIVPSASDFKWTSLTYTPAAGTPEKPTFSIPGGIFTEAQSVELDCETEGAEIFYTLDGTEPTSSSTKYTAAIAISQTTTIKAIAINNSVSSIVVSETYTIVSLEGEGTKDKPYTVGDVIKLESSRSDTAWVAGYILGGFSNKGIDNTSASGIALGATANAETYIPVQLVGGTAPAAQLAARAALNVVDHSENIGAFVKVRGALEKYSNRNGVKGTNDYEIVSMPTAISNTAVEAKAVKTIVNGQLLITRDGKTFNVLGTQVR